MAFDELMLVGALTSPVEMLTGDGTPSRGGAESLKGAILSFC